MRPYFDDIAVLHTARTEFEARAIVLALEAEGVDARVVGGTPGDGYSSISVLVRRADLPVATLALEVIRLEAATIDWSDVPTDPEEAPAEGPSSAPPATPLARSRAAVYTGPAASSTGGIVLITTRDTLLRTLPPDARAAPGALLLATGVIWGCAVARRSRRPTDRT